MNMLWYYVPTIIFVMFGVSILAAQCARSAYAKSRGQVSWVTMEPVTEDWTKDARDIVLAHRAPKPEPVEEVDPRLEEWIAAELEKDFEEESLSSDEPVWVKHMLLTDAATGVKTDLEVGVLLNDDGQEVSDVHRATSALGKDSAGRWWDVSLKDFSWETPTIH